MIRVLPFRRGHLGDMQPQPGQRLELVTLGRAVLLERSWSFTVIDEQARVLMCAGAVPVGDGPWWGWALLSVLARRRMLPLTRAMQAIMPMTPCQRLRTTVRWGFPEGHSWVTMLGFRALPELHRIDGIWCAVYERELTCGT